MRTTEIIKKIDELFVKMDQNINNELWDSLHNRPVRIETRVLNVTYYMGQYRTLLRMLNERNWETYINVSDGHSLDANRALEFTNQIYEWLEVNK